MRVYSVFFAHFLLFGVASSCLARLDVKLLGKQRSGFLAVVIVGQRRNSIHRTHHFRTWMILIIGQVNKVIPISNTLLGRRISLRDKANDLQSKRSLKKP